MTTPDEEVAERIIAELTKARILSQAGLDRLQEKLSAGAMSSSDWRLLFETDRPEKAEADGD